MKNWKYFMMTSIVGSALMLGACGNGDKANESSKGASQTAESNANAESSEKLEGKISGDGSSTVSPIMEAIVEEYSAEQPKVQVSVGVSGTGGGFEKFINGETDFSNASRPIKDEEATKLKEKKIDYTEMKIAYDGLSIVVNKDNTWLKDATVKELKEIWIESGKEKKWSDINPKWPNEKIVYYSPGTESGTYDYFVNDILEGKDLVKSATLSEDDNVLVKGVESDKNAIGYFGFAYYLANKDKLQIVKVDGVEPTHDTIKSGEYTPLSRPLFVYVKNEAVKNNPVMYNFLEYTIKNAGAMAEAVGYVQSPEEDYTNDQKELEALK
ncbi:phosphate ABC transporter substrate-binding protein [Kurthia zopfii]|uniref:Phosphate-binding protein n=1 Tax=Kurthia zopfii TaxID=1650 RepID=A0A2U3A9L1_9BACL|nr:PstS family phosphate ABC transporter substrate-binding protein [Kurthia zopfii]PWI21234.1 phosphate-binding protein [Kurthia zopfii]TDR33684.1 phosphate ABC transporter substrate-binding protein (PhoT family) [Kurthia zopfii]STX10019.1 Phosphate-binding protein pstS precursor [Kurthia zopfii]VEI07615.1 Phosphate-binding protein pstS precursor [Kurthia zopfii]GEK32066.1 phosphate ABC transporter substrate-binding protein [Kurthia zopfii]